MKLIWFVLPVIAYLAGVLSGYFMRKRESRSKNRKIWDRMERRNIMRTINSLVSAIDFKDHLTRSHSDNVSLYACAIARELGMSQADINTLKDACQLHDLGKIGVHDHILTKPGALTEEEEHEMRLHSLAGAVILKPFRFLNTVVELIRQHHERYDGTGYPDGLLGEKINIGARIMAVADSFDAMTSRRHYRTPLGLDEAIAELRKHSGTQFDPEVVKIFIALLEKKPELFNPVREMPYEKKSS